MRERRGENKGKKDAPAVSLPINRCLVASPAVLPGGGEGVMVGRREGGREERWIDGWKKGRKKRW